jgi:hypothetical protein
VAARARKDAEKKGLLEKEKATEKANEKPGDKPGGKGAAPRAGGRDE